MTAPLEVLIAGGGVAGLETTLALRKLAGSRVNVTLVAPQPEFLYRPMAVGAPFAHPSAERYDVDTMAAEMGATLVVDSLPRRR